MCLEIEEVKKSKQKPQPKVAKRNIKCYKDLVEYPTQKIAKSPVRDFYWSKGCNHYTELGEPEKNISSKSLTWIWAWVINEGFHAYRKKKYGCNALMVIPKGAKYYKGREKEIVSDQMIFKKFL